MERGAVSYTMYLCYIRNFTYIALMSAFITFVISTGFSIGTNFWLSAWSESGLNTSVSRGGVINIFQTTKNGVGRFYAKPVALPFGFFF